MKPEVGEFIRQVWCRFGPSDLYPARSLPARGPGVRPSHTAPLFAGDISPWLFRSLSGPRGGIARRREAHAATGRMSLLFRSPPFCCFWASLSEKTFEFRIKRVTSPYVLLSSSLFPASPSLPFAEGDFLVS